MSTARILINQKEVAIAILRGVRDHVDAALRQAAAAIRGRIGDVAESLIRGSEEFQSLLGGDLQGHMGLANPESTLAAILRAIRDGVEVWADPTRIVGDHLEGGINVGVLRQGHADLLSLAEAEYVSDPSGETIPWLKWLLTQGDRVLIQDWGIRFDVNKQERTASRSKKAIMVLRAEELEFHRMASALHSRHWRRRKPRMFRPVEDSWRVPPEYAGTEFNNFLTRAFDVPAAESLFIKIMTEEVTKRL